MLSGGRLGRNAVAGYLLAATSIEVARGAYRKAFRRCVDGGRTRSWPAQGGFEGGGPTPKAYSGSIFIVASDIEPPEPLRAHSSAVSMIGW